MTNEMLIVNDQEFFRKNVLINKRNVVMTFPQWYICNTCQTSSTADSTTTSAVQKV